MTPQKFTKVGAGLWRSARFLNLTTEQQVLFLFLLSSPHQNSSGAYRLPDGYAAADLRWDMSSYVRARTSLVDAELISFAETSSELFIERWFQHCPPQNQKHAVGTLRLIRSIEDVELKAHVLEQYKPADPWWADHPSDQLQGNVTRLLGLTRR